MRYGAHAPRRFFYPLRAPNASASAQDRRAAVFPGGPQARRPTALHGPRHPHSAESVAISLSDPGRYDPCPCGSDKKYKRRCALRSSVLPDLKTG